MAQGQGHHALAPEATLECQLVHPVLLWRKIWIAGGYSSAIERGVGDEVVEIELTDIAFNSCAHLVGAVRGPGDEQAWF